MSDLPDPAQIVQRFLAMMEARDLAAAEQLLAPEFTMLFPGSAPMNALQDLLDWSAPRYRNVRKRFDGFDVVPAQGGASVVYCRGTLSGTWLDGTDFDGIRFIDRFEIAAGRITRQDVWNDVAETRGKPKAAL